MSACLCLQPIATLHKKTISMVSLPESHMRSIGDLSLKSAPSKRPR